MSDTTIVEKMRDIIRTVTVDNDVAFLSDSVVIDSWDFLDESIEGEPFCRLESPALINNRWDSMDCPITLWLVRVVLVKPFDDWEETRIALRKLRTAGVDTFNINTATTSNRSLDGMAGVSVEEIRDEFNDVFLALYDNYVEPENEEEILPNYLSLPVLFEIEERTNS